MTENTISIEDDESEDEEEMLVYCDFDSLASTEDFNEGGLKIIGIDDYHPIVQVNDKIFKGTYNYSMGTNLFFHRDEQAVDDTDPLYGPFTPLLYKYYGKSIKCLKMERIFVRPIDNTETGSHPNPAASDESKKFVITKTYSEALNQLLAPGEHPPRNLADDENNQMDIDLRTSSSTITASKTNENGDEDEEEEPEDDPKDEDYIPYEMDVG